MATDAERLALVAELARLRADSSLILAAVSGSVLSIECSMPICLCPDGRGYFEKCGNPLRGPWGPSPDRYPLPGRHGGGYVVGNVRLSHLRCNKSEGGRVGGKISAPRTQAILRANGYYRSAKHRENAARLGRAMPHEGHVRAGRIGILSLTAEMRLRGGLAASPVGRERLRAWHRRPDITPVLARSGRIGACQRWQVLRGRPCVCGSHEEGRLQ